MGLSLECLRQQVEEIIGQASHLVVRFGSIGLTSRACTVLQLSRREALRLGHDYISSEHLLLGRSPRVRASPPRSQGADLREVRSMLCRNPTAARTDHLAPPQ